MRESLKQVRYQYACSELIYIYASIDIILSQKKGSHTDAWPKRTDREDS